jgi:hypothetical protein
MFRPRLAPLIVPPADRATSHDNVHAVPDRVPHFPTEVAA